METKTKKITAIAYLFLSPLVSFAEAGTPASGGATLVSVKIKILQIINTFSGLLVGLAVVFFVYGLLGYVTAHDEKKVKEARDTIVYGILGLFVMVSVWGLVDLVMSTLQLNTIN